MDAIEYLDSLVKEYLLFRGYTRAVSAVQVDADTDPGLGYQAERLGNQLFHFLIPGLHTQQLVQLLNFLEAHVFSKLSAELRQAAADLHVSISCSPCQQCLLGLEHIGPSWLVFALLCFYPGDHNDVGSVYMQTAVLRCFIITAVQKKHLDKVHELFRLAGSQLSSGKHADTWTAWFSLPYLRDAHHSPQFQVCTNHLCHIGLKVAHFHQLDQALASARKRPRFAGLLFSGLGSHG